MGVGVLATNVCDESSNIFVSKWRDKKEDYIGGTER